MPQLDNRDTYLQQAASLQGDNATHADYLAVIDALKSAAAAYYDGTTIVMSDADYDFGISVLTYYEDHHPDSIVDHGLLTAVAGGTSAGGDVTHPVPMLSLDKAADHDAVTKFINSLPAGTPVTVEPKMDGMAIRAVYTRGRLTLAATRGNGTTGEDVTAQILRAPGVTGLPAQLSEPLDIEVRGEVYLTDAQFDTASDNRVASGRAPYANPRNAGAGALRNSDLDYEVPMSFACYDLIHTDTTADTSRSAAANLHAYTAVGITTALDLLPDGYTTLTTAEQVIARLDLIEQLRPALGFPIDGAVIKVDDTDVRDTLGLATRTPRWAVAFKYAPAEAISTLRDIQVLVGRTGRASFRAVIDPVEVGGTTVSFASGHNAPWIEAAGLAIGQRVMVVRRGDVIPYISVAVGEQPEGLTPWTAPDTCPQCGEPWNKDSKLWRCETPSCSLVGSLVWWCSRDAMDVDRVGQSICEALVEHELVKDVSGLYDLTVEQLTELPMGTTTTGGVRRLGESNAREIVSGLERSKQQPFNRVLTALGMRGTGRSVSRWLAREFKTMDALRAATVDQIAEIDKMGPVKAGLVVEGLAKLAPVIDRLSEQGLAMAVEDTGGDKPLAGLTIVVSGSVPGYTRTTAQERIEALGGSASSSVSAKTSYLVTAETDTSKAKKAVQLGIPIMDPAEFASILNQA